MYEISVKQHFDAAHFLRGYQGKCENLHGHRFEVVARVTAKDLNELGMAYDFTELKKHLGAVVGRLDHVPLNDTKPFDGINPSSENLARTIFQELQSKLKGAPVTLSAVEVWESPESCAKYSPNP